MSCDTPQRVCESSWPREGWRHSSEAMQSAGAHAGDRSGPHRRRRAAAESKTRARLVAGVERRLKFFVRYVGELFPLLGLSSRDDPRAITAASSTGKGVSPRHPTRVEPRTTSRVSTI